MRFHRLTCYLMQQAMRMSGDPKRITVHRTTGVPVYDIDTGESTVPGTPYIVRRAFMGALTDEDKAKLKIAQAEVKFVMARSDIAYLPETDDVVTVGDTDEPIYRIEKVVEDLTQASLMLCCYTAS